MYLKIVIERKYRITTVIKDETDIIPSIAASPTE